MKKTLHIFGKDIALLWIFVAAVIVLAIVLALIFGGKGSTKNPATGTDIVQQDLPATMTDLQVAERFGDNYTETDTGEGEYVNACELHTYLVDADNVVLANYFMFITLNGEVYVNGSTNGMDPLALYNIPRDTVLGLEIYNTDGILVDRCDLVINSGAFGGSVDNSMLTLTLPETNYGVIVLSCTEDGIGFLGGQDSPLDTTAANVEVVE